MKDLIDNLESNLKEQLLLHRQILNFSKAKHDAIVGNQLDELQRILQSEEALVQRVQAQEEKRETILFGLCEHLGMDKKSIKLKNIIEKIDSHYRPGLICVRKRLLDMISEIQSQNDMNRELFKQALSHIQNFLRRLSGLDGHAYAYGKNGQDVTNAGKNLVVNQMV